MADYSQNMLCIVMSEQNKNIKIVTRRTEVNYLIISEFFDCNKMFKYNICNHNSNCINYYGWYSY
jgi:hypothetical protein